MSRVWRQFSTTVSAKPIKQFVYTSMPLQEKRILVPATRGKYKNKRIDFVSNSSPNQLELTNRRGHYDAKRVSGKDRKKV